MQGSLLPCPDRYIGDVFQSGAVVQYRMTLYPNRVELSAHPPLSWLVSSQSQRLIPRWCLHNSNLLVIHGIANPQHPTELYRLTLKTLLQDGNQRVLLTVDMTIRSMNKTLMLSITQHANNIKKTELKNNGTQSCLVAPGRESERHREWEQTESPT